jgi:lipopolysaccharide biosynthesis glycosyltransferase
MNVPIRVFIGFDSKEPISAHVLAHSIIRRTSVPVAITFLTLQSLTNRYTRERGPTESTEFSLTRFLVPSLCDFKGYAIFMDSDQLMLTDIADVFIDSTHLPERAVYVCQHDYTPNQSTKFLGQVQTAYPKKNWSSFMVFNNAHCKSLTEDYVNTATGLDLHRFNWTYDQQIGALPLEWNWLVGEYEPNPNAHNLHFTTGGPWFQATATCEHADLWWAEYAHMRRCEQGADRLEAVG